MHNGGYSLLPGREMVHNVGYSLLLGMRDVHNVGYSLLLGMRSVHNVGYSLLLVVQGIPPQKALLHKDVLFLHHPFHCWTLFSPLC